MDRRDREPGLLGDLARGGAGYEQGHDFLFALGQGRPIEARLHLVAP